MSTEQLRVAFVLFSFDDVLNYCYLQTFLNGEEAKPQQRAILEHEDM